MKKEVEKCMFFDASASDEGGLLLKELILRGYYPLPLASDGILVIGNKESDKKVKGGITTENVFI
jgi:hypothetical protein